ncbi:uncharacterized protein LOC115709247 isoform X2 [Cannabis sativa]|uniref:uncharacterized protein LOC115709247 isoform X2 n=1 Tax=Cannabis sativa TaxID=3483 RepID=UPI0029CA47DD|nr:uncharacterized protein LOC115709247 isoform X2 [Cannabis sativa]
MILISRLHSLRWVTVVSLIGNSLLILLAASLFLIAFPSCHRRLLIPFLLLSLFSLLRILTTFCIALAQKATAMTIVESPALDATPVVDTVVRHERRMRYKRWLWWTRFGMFVTMLQFIGATYLVFTIATYVSHENDSSDCILGLVPGSCQWKQHLLIFFMFLACAITILHCFTGSEVLKWRSYYGTKDDAWKSHYREVFDHGIREVLCCLGRAKYLSALEEDEVFSVARLLGDLVAYRASGTGHLELLAGLALMQKQSESSNSYDECMKAPAEQIQEAATLHKFAEAAYTGPLLDFGRNPFLFPCVWLYRQGILNPWMRNRRPKLDGDNWWRGNAAAFLKHTKLPPEVLRKGRVNQAKCEAAYFVIVLHHLRSVLIAVRGTETPEDLIIDGLCRECILSAKDLDGMINGHVNPEIKQKVVSSFPHYGHSGIVEAARNLFIQIEGKDEDDVGNANKVAESSSDGLLSSLLGAGCECEGYKVRIVGHSLGGAIAAVLGMRLYHRYPNLHVYAYGPLPCVDSIVADACSPFVTSIVLNNEFSSRLSVGSVLRLRAAALTALSQDSTTDTAMIFRLARRFLYVSNYERTSSEVVEPASNGYSGTKRSENQNEHTYGNQEIFDSRGREKHDHNFSLFNETDNKDFVVESEQNEFSNPFVREINRINDPVSEFMESVRSSESASAGNPPEMYLPGRLIHVVPQTSSFHMSLWKGQGIQEREKSYKAYVANRESFKDIVVSPSMFLDHLPWRCDYALRKVLETQCTANHNESHHQIVDVY